MSKIILGVHGIRAMESGIAERSVAGLAQQWTDNVRHGLASVAYPEPAEVQVAMAYYGEIIGNLAGPTPAELGASEVARSLSPPADDDEFEARAEQSALEVSAISEAMDLDDGDARITEWLRAWNERYERFRKGGAAGTWQEFFHLAAVREATNRATARASRGWELDATGRERLALSTSVEVLNYVDYPELRARARDVVIDALKDHSPRIVVAHSLGTVVSYEALHHSGAEIDLWVTLGSPLGAPATIFDTLNPAPQSGRGRKPPGVRRWINVASRVDPVAVVPDLAAIFDGVAADLHPALAGAGMHAVGRYLRNPAVAGVLVQHL